jgi:hypothetical protein
MISIAAQDDVEVKLMMVDELRLTGLYMCTSSFSLDVKVDQHLAVNACCAALSRTTWR